MDLGKILSQTIGTEMREFYITIDDALLTGLRPETRIPRNSPLLYDCFGFRIGKKALEGIENLHNPLPALDMHYNWPFPQFLVQEKWKILVVRDNVLMADVVYSLDDSYAVTHIFTIDEMTYSQGSLMELADFGEYAFMTNGVIMIYWDPDLGPVGAWQQVTSLSTIPMMRTVCNFKGQMIGGCILSGWPLAEPQCDETYIAWSNIGDASFVPNERNEAGYRRDPYGGEVYHVRRLGDDIIVYSSKGITRMVPVSSPAATFGFEELHGVGLKNRGALGGDLNQHLFVDLENYVFKLNREGLKELGYSEYVEALSNGDNIVNFNQYKGDFYISDEDEGLLISPYGATRYPYQVSAIWNDTEASEVPVDLLTDGELELWTGDDLDHWAETENGGSIIEEEGVIVYEGLHSCKIKVDVNGAQVGITQAPIGGYDVGDRYQLSFRAYGDGVNSIHVCDDLHDIGGLLENPIPPAAWTKYAYNFIANNESDRVQISNTSMSGPAGPPAWIFYIDDIRLEKIITPDRTYYGLLGIPVTPSPFTHEPLLVSDIVDMGYRAQKTIFSIELGASTITDAMVAIDWRMSTEDAFQRTDFVSINNEGIASLVIAGIEFRVVVKATEFARDVSKLDYIVARWKMTDLRGLRGVYAAPPRGQI